MGSPLFGGVSRGAPLSLRLVNIFSFFSSAFFNGEDELGFKFRRATNLEAE
jgi:hypothetical protein